VTRIYVKPAKGRAVPDPESGGRLLPETGGWVPGTAYWQRRLGDKDVVEAKAPAEPVVKAEAQTNPTNGSKAE
jgi:hypothetical protein